MSRSRQRLAEPPALAARRTPPLRWFSLSLLIGVALVYAQVAGYGFVNYDDPDYVGENPMVLDGLSTRGLAWALTSMSGGNWFPVTWLSHMTDVQVFGLSSGAHHLTSVAIHAASTLLLFAFLAATTKRRWASAFVAGMFALHPLHVESVAWLSERKDVLSAMFWFLTLVLYARYVDRPGKWRYIAVLGAFVLGAMSKAMVVTLPFTLLLVDAWPLGRWKLDQTLVPPRPLLIEKVPLILLAAATAVIAFIAQQGAGAVASLDVTPIAIRAANALVSVVVYLRQSAWPAGLSIFYPYPSTIPIWQSIGAALLVTGISLTVFTRRRERPYLIVGWLWFLGTLVPVIGLVQIGSQAHADRYMYVPLVGLAIAVVWLVADWVERRQDLRRAVVAAGLTVVIGLAVVAFFQVRHWRDSESLFRHAVSVTTGNYVAHNNLGLALRDRSRPYEAIEHYREAIRARPRFADAQINLGAALLGLSQAAEAVDPLRAAIAIDPSLPEAHVDLGAALNALGKPDEAAVSFREAVRLAPSDAAAHMGLSTALARLGRIDESAAESREAARLDPSLASAHLSLGNELIAQGRYADAVAEFSICVQLDPDDLKARTNLGSALATLGRYDEAIAQFTEVLRRRPDLDDVRKNLEYAKELKVRKK